MSALTSPVRPGFRRSPLDVAQLTELARALVRDEQLWLPRVRFGTRDRRWWTRLHGSETLDVWLLTWLPGHTTDLHDHGASSAAYAVARGALEEVRVADGRTTSTVLPAGSAAWVAAGVAHDVRGVGAEPAVSIHAYSPPLVEMTHISLG